LTDIGPGFYGVVFRESDLSYALKNDTLEFLTADFDLSTVSSKPRVAIGASVARLTDIGPGFYGISVKQSNNAAHFKGINVINFESASFYIEQNTPNTDEVTVNFRGSSGSGSGVSAHNALTGLVAPADDHTQYFHVDGRRRADHVRAGGFYLDPGALGIGYSLGISSIPIDITSPIVTNYWLDSWVPQGYVIDNVKLACASGDCAVGFYIQPKATSLNPHGTAVVGTVGRSEWGTGWGEFYIAPAIRTAIATSQNVMRQDSSLIMSVFVNNNAQHIRGRLVVKLSG
jgi:hypothetical protein